MCLSARSGERRNSACRSALERPAIGSVVRSTVGRLGHGIDLREAFLSTELQLRVHGSSRPSPFSFLSGSRFSKAPVPKAFVLFCLRPSA